MRRQFQVSQGPIFTVVAKFHPNSSDNVVAIIPDSMAPQWADHIANALNFYESHVEMVRSIAEKWRDGSKV